jgi:hypothetical protein
VVTKLLNYLATQELRQLTKHRFSSSREPTIARSIKAFHNARPGLPTGLETITITVSVSKTACRACSTLRVCLRLVAT